MKLFGWEILKCARVAQYEREMESERSAVRKLRAKRVRTVPASALPDKEVVQILGGLGESPAWAALHQELDAAIMDAIEDVSVPPDPNKPAPSRDFAAGGVDYLRKFQARLIDIGQQVQVKDADLE